MFVTVCQQRTSTVPKKHGTCGITVLNSTVGTGTVEKSYLGAAVVHHGGSTVVPRNTSRSLPTSCNECRTAPDVCRPLNQANRLEP